LVRQERNARRHDARQIGQLAQSIERFGFLTPVLIDADNRLLCGHARVEAACLAGSGTVPAIRVSHLSATERRALAIADNRLAELASWDEDVLKNELRFLSEIDIDFDFSAIGFDTPEIDLLLNASPAAAAEDDRLPALEPDRPCVSEPGQVWLLGEHRLVCGDALKAGSYRAALGETRARMVFADPPYNVRINGHVGGTGAVRHREFAMASGEMTAEEFEGFLATSFAHMANFSVDGAIHFVCMDWRHLNEALAAGTASYTELKNICVWRKNNGGMGSLYRSQHEMILVFKSGRASHVNNVALGAHGRYRTNVWDYPGINSFGRDRDAQLALHPTVKPVALVADAIQDCSNRRDIVLDPFGGAGTTIIAAARTKRRAVVIELDPLYVDTIVRRWQDFGGEPARCARTGRTFEQCARERAFEHHARERAGTVSEPDAGADPTTRDVAHE
jgi:DNA modification methylase